MRLNLIILFSGFILFQGCKKNEESKNHFVDSRDNEKYEIIEIGNQTWMAENLRFIGGKLLKGNGKDSVSNLNTPLYYFYFKDSVNYYNKYGALYTLTAAKSACPSGWHLPSDEEWKELESSLGMPQEEINKFDWRGINEGSKLTHKGASGFNALFSGYRDSNGGYHGLENITVFWNSIGNLNHKANNRTLFKSKTTIQRDFAKSGNGFCVRCIKDK